MYQLFFDSDCDVTLEIAKKYNAILIGMPYAINGEEVTPYKDWEVFNAKEFYDTLRKGNANPTTSALSVQEYINYFEPVLKEGKDILYVHFSREMSATFKSADTAISELLPKYPGRRIQLIDTKGITICSLLSCIRIGDLVNEGKSIDEILAVKDEIINHSAAYFFADNLKFFARSGRVSGFSAFMGGMIGVKPVIHISDEGKMVSIDTAVGRKKVLEKIMEYVVKREDHIKDYPVIIAHADAPALVELFTKMLKDNFGEDIKYIVVDVNPTAGCHCGPDVLGIGFHAKER
jgi:DegV family protein with EDD domain